MTNKSGNLHKNSNQKGGQEPGHPSPLLMLRIPLISLNLGRLLPNKLPNLHNTFIRNVLHQNNGQILAPININQATNIRRLILYELNINGGVPFRKLVFHSRRDIIRGCSRRLLARSGLGWDGFSAAGIRAVLGLCPRALRSLRWPRLIGVGSRCLTLSFCGSRFILRRGTMLRLIGMLRQLVRSRIWEFDQ